MTNEKKWIGEGLKPNSVNCNVLNVLRTLIENENTIVYIPDGYKKGSTSSSLDSRVHFYPSEAGRRIEVVGITSNQERFNFSLQGLVNVLVEQDLPNSTEVKLVPKKVWRQYNIIRDSKLMFDYIIARLDEESFNDLRDAGLLYYNGMQVPENHCFNSDFLYKVMLKDIPLISLNWAQPVNIGLYKMMKEDLLISNKLKDLKILKSDLIEKTGFVSKPSEDSDIYIEKYDTSKISTKLRESYEANCITYSLSGSEIKTSPDDLEIGYINSFDTVEKVIKEMSCLSKRQKELRFMIRCIIMAIENSKKQGSYNWSDEYLVPRSKNRYRKETTIEVDGELIKLVRDRYTKKVNL